MPNGLMSCNLNAENILQEATAIRQAPQCDIYDRLRPTQASQPKILLMKLIIK
ncbi:hypothetical protein H6H03_21265 [Nostoc paludosum FACHB-159]|uniref:Uncharacterized protein n=1 Tax=Nostoc paludosum FACHB-159 TaxID=2692908 RepID=A0ABR8KE57_9NOSO|nr:hypothetical protein [Nostoc paludosum FACHB-159]